MPARLNQVKIPVTDLQRSVSWYGRLLGLTLWREFIEDGVLCGAVLSDEESGLRIGLRLRAVISGEPAFPGFDLFSIAVDSGDELGAIVERCEAMGTAHGEMTVLGADGTVVDVPDPDGTVVRFIYLHPDRPLGFIGIDLPSDAGATFYDTPQLDT